METKLDNLDINLNKIDKKLDKFIECADDKYATKEELSRIEHQHNNDKIDIKDENKEKKRDSHFWFHAALAVGMFLLGLIQIIALMRGI